jgi:hypothetical protein
VNPVGFWHELVGAQLSVRLYTFVTEHRLGSVVGSGAGFRLPGANVRSPDVPFYVLDRIGEYLEAGVRTVWVIDPRKRRAVVYRSLSDIQVIDAAASSMVRTSCPASAAPSPRSWTSNDNFDRTSPVPPLADTPLRRDDGEEVECGHEDIGRG